LQHLPGQPVRPLGAPNKERRVSIAPETYDFMDVPITPLYLIPWEKSQSAVAPNKPVNSSLA
jgi:hypothetical protein